jgi:hypothetical protein
MATANAGVSTAYNVGPQNLYTITNPGLNIFPNPIAYIDKASTALVTTSFPTIISNVGAVSAVAGSGPWTATITVTGSHTLEGIQVGSIITALDDGGNIGTGTVHVTSVIGNKSITIEAVGGTTPVNGAIENISIPATVTIPGTMVDGDLIALNDIGGMTELISEGHDGTNQYYVKVISQTTFELYSDPDLNNGVDSSGFTTYTENSGNYNTFTVTEYNSIGNSAPMTFNTTETDIGTDINIDHTTGEITLAADITYQMTALAFPGETSFLNALGGATYQFYDESGSAFIGVSAPIGSPLVTTVTPSVENVYQVKIVSHEGLNFRYPDQIVNATLNVVAVSGFDVS